ncbi:VPLPA-CTERM sorting domain-containing protein [Sulfuricella sp. T08]|uniref:VPLPA-CTERM sorting domain-containing protein n=1 Tax=Sulfuricella sp. T08 TaxID=1632857 RepID=UPI001184BD62|nr:VPLPA-CTERM sorting domain-containing protein [Sulfuricella sp. T08]
MKVLPSSFLIFFLSISTCANAAISFDESVSGDIDTYPQWQLGIGNNTFAGTMSLGAYTDIDSFSFYVPYGMKATISLNATSLSINTINNTPPDIGQFAPIYPNPQSGFGGWLYKQPGQCGLLFGISPWCLFGGQYQSVDGTGYSIDTSAITIGGALMPTLLIDSPGPYNLMGQGYQLFSFGSSSTQDVILGYSASIQVESVPVPAAIWLLGSGLLGLVGMARRPI